MQTFLPLPNFKETAKVLDRQRCGKQRVEALQILYILVGLDAHTVNVAIDETNAQTKISKRKKTAWVKHPAVLMWKGHEKALVRYGLTMCQEWISRGYKDTCTKKFLYVDSLLRGEIKNPDWVGDEKFHLSHKSNLVRKLPSHYGKIWPNVSGDLEYVWPIKGMTGFD